MKLFLKKILKELFLSPKESKELENKEDHINKIIIREKAVISCVGARPLAVISPIKTLIIRKSFKPEHTSIILMPTSQTQKKAEDCKEWFLEAFPEIAVEIVVFDDKNLPPLMEHIKKSAEKIYFNSDPGMNWQIAKMVIHLPQNTQLMYADYEFLYLWPIDKDIKDSYKLGLANLGFELYNRFSDKRFIKKEGINDALNESIKALLKTHNYNEHFEVEYEKPPTGKLCEIIKNRLVWARERHGIVYLLFDFLKKTNEKDKQDEKYNDLAIYRAITNIFDPLKFIITIITDDLNLKERATIDGIGFLFLKRDSNADLDDKFKGQLINWIEEKVWYRPKTVLPGKARLYLDQFDFHDNETNETESCLFVCVGDNIETTLKAIRYHGLKNVFVFFDENAYRIKWAAMKIKETLKDVNIKLLPTNNMGYGIMDKIIDISRGVKDIHINITPGTKSQGVAMCQAARNIGRLDSLFSIDKDIAKSLSDSSVTLKINDTDQMEVIKCNIAPFKEYKSIHEDPIYLTLMEGLSKNTIFRGANILELKNRKKMPIFSKLSEDFEGQSILTCVLDNKVHNFPDEFFDEKIGGIWWEAAVAYTIKKNLTENVLWSVKWNWFKKKKKNDKFFSEIDIVFPFQNYICAVSCKSGAARGLDEIVRYEIKSEAERRFGRFSLPFIAVPFDKYNGKEYKGKIYDDVMYLTPSLLLDKNELYSTIEMFAESKRTTSTKKQNDIQ